jgi:hypothetical protein
MLSQLGPDPATIGRSVFAVPESKYCKTFLLDPTRYFTFRWRKRRLKRTGNSMTFWVSSCPSGDASRWLLDIAAIGAFPAFTGENSQLLYFRWFSQHARSLSFHPLLLRSGIAECSGPQTNVLN